MDANDFQVAVFGQQIWLMRVGDGNRQMFTGGVLAFAAAVVSSHDLSGLCP